MLSVHNLVKNTRLYHVFISSYIITRLKLRSMCIVDSMLKTKQDTKTYQPSLCVTSYISSHTLKFETLHFTDSLMCDASILFSRSFIFLQILSINIIKVMRFLNTLHLFLILHACVYEGNGELHKFRSTSVVIHDNSFICT